MNTPRVDGNVLNVFMHKTYPSISRAEGVYLYDEEGRRYIDGSGGPILVNLGHGLKEMARVLGEQAEKVAYVHRMDFTNPPLEEAATKLCQASGGALARVFFVSGGSEATEIGIKLARKFHLEEGRSSKFKIISRWQSYHGSTMGALSWTGFTSRRADFVPYLGGGIHIAPAYCYRCWFGARPESCGLECASALENEILCQGPETVAGFIAEPVSGMSLCGAVPHPDYFRRVREICDRYQVLLILDEVMTGAGRTGKMFAYEHFGIEPDIVALGKGLGGGYFPIGAAAVSPRVYEAMDSHSGIFGAGHSWSGNPLGCAVVAKALDYLKEHDLVARCARMGDYLARRLERLREHPLVGDIRGLGLMQGVEFVAEKATRKPLEKSLGFSARLAHECLKRGLFIEYSSGCDRGQGGDMIMFGPPFIVTEEQIEEMVAILEEALAQDLAGSAGPGLSF